jgi:ATP dependent DNA ligase domain
MSAIPKNQQEVLTFAGKGNIENGILVMPKLWSLAKTGRYHWWQMKIGIAYTDDDAGDPVNNEDDRIPVDQNDIERASMDEGAVGFYWSEFAQEEGKVQDPSPKFVTIGKNIGRNNETTPFTQAILDARTEYNKRVRKGNLEDKSLLITHDAHPTIEDLIKLEHRGDKPWRIFPMALTDISKPNAEKHLVYPCDIQPKYDGTLTIIVYHPDLPKQTIVDPEDGEEHEIPIDIYSRGGESVEGQNHLLLEAWHILELYPGLHLVGEAYKEGSSLQDISGTARRQADGKTQADGKSLLLDLMVFDCFYIDKAGVDGESWTERKERLQTIMDVGRLRIAMKVGADGGADGDGHLKLVMTQEVANRKEMDIIYRQFLEDGMEGAVLRNLDSPYEVGLAKEIRSKWSFKVKPRLDDEWPVVSYKSGSSGKAKNAVIWIFAESDAGVKERVGKILPLKERKSFSADYTGGMNMDKRNAIYNYLEHTDDFEKLYYGKLMTITYFRLSNDGLPQQPKALRFRDVKIQESLMTKSEQYYVD